MRVTKVHTLCTWSFCVFVLICSGCATKIPNVRPFADSTATLYQASGSETQAVLTGFDDSIDLAGEILRQSELRLPQDPRDRIKEVRDGLRNNKATYRKISRDFDTVLQQAVVYSERLAELAAAGETGAAAAESLAGTINQFGTLVGSENLISGPIADILRRIADYKTRVEARESLHAAALVAQGAVADVGDALIAIYGDSSQLLVTGLAAHHDQLLIHQAGASIVGYYREANDRRDMFYRRALLTLRGNDDGISGFCRTPETGEVDSDCINLREMEALREVEDRLTALEPEFVAYQTKRNDLRAWRNTRRANGARLMRAVDAWVTEHQNVVDALEDGAGVSAFSLRAILAEIQASK